MAYAIYNLTNLIPVGSNTRNFGIYLTETDCTVSAGRYVMVDEVHDNTRRQTEKRVKYNGIDYKILDVVEVPNVTSKADRKLIEEKLKSYENNLKGNMKSLQDEQARKLAHKKAKIQIKRQQIVEDTIKRNLEVEREVFKRASDSDKFVVDGKSVLDDKTQDTEPSETVVEIVNEKPVETQIEKPVETQIEKPVETSINLDDVVIEDEASEEAHAEDKPRKKRMRKSKTKAE